jgi:hypothetical protein
LKRQIMNIAEKTLIESKYKKGNKILFSKDSECLHDLIRLMEIQIHRTLVMWALECAKETLSRLEGKYPNEPRPRMALELCEKWTRGNIKMPQAKRSILAAHAVAKEIDDKECIALVHAIGHAGATVHVGTHAVGLVFYELTAIVHAFGIENCEKAIDDKIKIYKERLLYWQKNIDTLNVSWARFLLDDTRLNKN